MADRVLVEVTIAAPADVVWDALSDPEKIYNWFGWEADSLKEEIDFIFYKYGRRDEVTKTLRFEGTEDRFELVDQGGTTLLRVVRGVSDGESWDDVYEDMNEGWISFVQQLRLAAENHGVGPRRTIYLNGSGAVPSKALGLTDARDTSPGQPVSVTLATGDRIDGIAWHRTPWQFGLTVPQWGDGLLIATDKSKTPQSPDGHGMVILTTYGLDEVEFDALAARWTDWWNATFAEAKEQGCG
jgi:hypothetical protein